MMNTVIPTTTFGESKLYAARMERGSKTVFVYSRSLDNQVLICTSSEIIRAYSKLPPMPSEHFHRVHIIDARVYLVGETQNPLFTADESVLKTLITAVTAGTDLEATFAFAGFEPK